MGTQELLDLIPLGTRVIVKQITIDKVGSLYLPENSREMKELMATEGKVLAAGPEVSAVSVGQTIFFGRYAGGGASVKRNGMEYLVMDQSDILAIVKKEERN